MSERILVHMTSGDDCIGLRTVSRSRKSPHWFYILRRELTGLRHNHETIVRDIYSFAALRRDAHAGTLVAKFTWLDSCGNGVAGYQETVTLPYIKNIGARAFEGCDKLTTVTIKSADLKSVGKNALKGISRTARIRVPSAKLSVYGKLLRNKGQSNRVKIRAM